MLSLSQHAEAFWLYKSNYILLGPLGVLYDTHTLNRSSYQFPDALVNEFVRRRLKRNETYLLSPFSECTLLDEYDRSFDDAK